jgi:hypothetical protein
MRNFGKLEVANRADREKEFIVKLFNLKKLAAVSALGLAAVLGTNVAANAQGNWHNDQNQVRTTNQQQNRWEQQRAKAEQDRIQAEQERQAEFNRRSTHSGNDRSWGNGYYNGNANANSNRNRYRVYRNGSYYNTDNRGVELLRQAVNAGYQQGFRAGQADRNGRRGLNWSGSNMYRSGTYGYQSYVDRGQYQYYFQQGFQRGYQDGYNSRYQYGFNNGGSLNILGTILNQVLNIQRY